MLQSTVVHFTASFSGVNATEDVDLNATLPPVVRARVARAAVGEDEVVVSDLRRGGTHAYGGAWAAHLLAAAGVLVMLASVAGFVGITTGVTAHLWTHFFFCAFAWSFAVAAAHTLLEHSDDTKTYLANHWQVIQTGVVGDNVAAEDAAAFATQHMRAAAALGALCAVFLSVSLAATVAALLVIHGWIGPGAHRRGSPCSAAGAARREAPPIPERRAARRWRTGGSRGRTTTGATAGATAGTTRSPLVLRAAPTREPEVRASATWSPETGKPATGRRRPMSAWRWLTCTTWCRRRAAAAGDSSGAAGRVRGRLRRSARARARRARLGDGGEDGGGPPLPVRARHGRGLI